MLNFIKTFAADEDGAVTVDWVVLTAAIVGLGLAVLAIIRPATTSVASGIAGELNYQNIRAGSGATSGTGG